MRIQYGMVAAGFTLYMVTIIEIYSVKAGRARRAPCLRDHLDRARGHPLPRATPPTRGGPRFTKVNATNVGAFASTLAAFLKAREAVYQGPVRRPGPPSTTMQLCEAAPRRPAGGGKSDCQFRKNNDWI